MRSTGRRSGLRGFCLSALIHVAIGAGVLWILEDRLVDGGEEHLVAVSLAMFELSGEIGPPPEPVIEPAPEPKAEPEPDPARKPEPVREPEPDPEPVRAPEPEPESVREPEPAPAPKPAPKPEADSKPKPEPRPEPRAESQPKPEPSPRPRSAPNPRAEPKPKPRPSRAPEPAAKPKPARGAPAVRSGSPGVSSSAKTTKPGAGSKALEAGYLSELRGAIARNRRYPERARRRGETGTVVVYFVIERNGRIGGPRVDKGSGSSALDKAAVESVQRLGKFKPFPEGIGRDRWALRVPIQFSLE